MEALRVIISGGFSLAYHSLLPGFEGETGIAVTTLSGASQGTGPKTIKYQVETGTDIDVVILSGEGLEDLHAIGRIAKGTARGLASAPLGAAVRQGSDRPDIATTEAFRAALLNARLVVMPGSTSGLYVRNEILPALGVADQVAYTVVPRGTDSTALLAAGGADLAIGPTSELVEQPGVDIVGILPPDVQLVQTFTAAIVDTSSRVVQARRLIDYLSAETAFDVIRKAGMEPAAA